MAENVKKEEMVTLVTTDVLTPYRKGEVFTVPKSQADRLLTRDMTQTDFGPKNPQVKVREYDPEKDESLLLENHVLNAREHQKLYDKLYGDKNKDDKNQDQNKQ